MNQTDRGAIAESMAATWAYKQGWVVSWASRGQTPRYDLIMDDGRALHRVQVKRAYLKDEVLVANLYHGKHTLYTPDDIDVFLIVDVDTRTLWWLPITGTAGKSRVRLTTPHMERHRVTTDNL